MLIMEEIWNVYDLSTTLLDSNKFGKQMRQVINATEEQGQGQAKSIEVQS